MILFAILEICSIIRTAKEKLFFCVSVLQGTETNDFSSHETKYIKTMEKINGIWLI